MTLPVQGMDKCTYAWSRTPAPGVTMWSWGEENLSEKRLRIPYVGTFWNYRTVTIRRTGTSSALNRFEKMTLRVSGSATTEPYSAGDYYIMNAYKTSINTFELYWGSGQTVMSFDILVKDDVEKEPLESYDIQISWSGEYFYDYSNVDHPYGLIRSDEY